MNIELPSTLAAGPLRATAAVEPMTLQALLDLILADASLPPTRRRDMASSIRTAGRIAGRPLAEIIADCETLNATVFPDVPQLAGLQPERFRNIVSGLRAALRHVGRHADDERMCGSRYSPKLARFSACVAAAVVSSTLASTVRTAAPRSSSDAFQRVRSSSAGMVLSVAARSRPAPSSASRSACLATARGPSGVT